MYKSPVMLRVPYSFGTILTIFALLYIECGGSVLSLRMK